MNYFEGRNLCLWSIACLVVLSGCIGDPHSNDIDEFLSKSPPDEDKFCGTRTLSRSFSSVVKMKKPIPCTGAVIGRNTVLTAAHCVSSKPVLDHTVKDSVIIVPRLIDRSFDFVEYEAICKHHPDFERTEFMGDSTADNDVIYKYDIALCQTKDSISQIPSGKFNRVNLNYTPSAVEYLVLAGYGCNVNSDYNSLFVGNSLFAGVAPYITNDDCVMKSPPYMEEYIKNYSLCTSGIDRGVAMANPEFSVDRKFDQSLICENGIAAVCKGDSGGPLFRVKQVKNEKVREIIGVTSRAGKFTDDAGSTERISYFDPVNDKKTKEFFMNWHKHESPICGLGTTAAELEQRCGG